MSAASGRGRTPSGRRARRGRSQRARRSRSHTHTITRSPMRPNRTGVDITLKTDGVVAHHSAASHDVRDVFVDLLTWYAGQLDDDMSPSGAAGHAGRVRSRGLRPFEATEMTRPGRDRRNWACVISAAPFARRITRERQVASPLSGITAAVHFYADRRTPVTSETQADALEPGRKSEYRLFSTSSVNPTP